MSLAGILYFALFKGLKSSGLIPTSVADYVGEHVLVTLLAFWAASSVVLWLLQRMRLNGCASRSFRALSRWRWHSRGTTW